MAGTYNVRFDMRETVPFVEGYVPLKPKVTGGFEVVRVAEDTLTMIRLQHLLVVTGSDGKEIVIKHWRQDWAYEPTRLLTYLGNSHWAFEDVPAPASSHAWSQIVWQTDDSPRYGGVGRWAYDNGVTRWTSNDTWRPLAQRDAILHPVYDRYLGTNRHALTPAGWIHEQDNAKIGTRDGKSVTFVHEIVLNTYQRDAEIPFAAADAYWDKTKDYWANVRALWDEAIERQGGITVIEEAEKGSATAPQLMGMAEDIADGKMTTAAALAEARTLVLSLPR